MDPGGVLLDPGGAGPVVPGGVLLGPSGAGPVIPGVVLLDPGWAGPIVPGGAGPVVPGGACSVVPGGAAPVVLGEAGPVVPGGANPGVPDRNRDRYEPAAVTIITCPGSWPLDRYTVLMTASSATEEKREKSSSLFSGQLWRGEERGRRRTQPGTLSTQSPCTQRVYTTGNLGLVPLEYSVLVEFRESSEGEYTLEDEKDGGDFLSAGHPDVAGGRSVRIMIPGDLLNTD